MKKQKTKSSLITLGLISLLWFCLAFAYNEGGTDEPTKPTPTETQTSKLTEQFVKNYIQHEEENNVAGDRPSVTVNLDFEKVSFGKPYTYELNSGFHRDIAVGQTVYPVKVIYTRTKQSEIRTETDTQEWDYLFYINSDGQRDSSATKVE